MSTKVLIKTDARDVYVEQIQSKYQRKPEIDLFEKFYTAIAGKILEVIKKDTSLNAYEVKIYPEDINKSSFYGKEFITYYICTYFVEKEIL